MPAAEAVRYIYAARRPGSKGWLFRRRGALRSDLPQLVKAARRLGFAVAVADQRPAPFLRGREKLVKAGLTACKFTFASHLPGARPPGRKAGRL